MVMDVIEIISAVIAHLKINQRVAVNAAQKFLNACSWNMSSIIIIIMISLKFHRSVFGKVQ